MSEKNLAITEAKAFETPRDEEHGTIEPIQGDDFYAGPRGRGELEVVQIRERFSVLRKLRAVETRLDNKLGVEKTGAERIPEDQRQPPSVMNIMFLWFSMVINPGLITMGLLGPVFGLSVNDSIIIDVFASGLGAVIPSFVGTLCPPTGLRQIAVSRYAFGIWGSKFCGLLNILNGIGFGTINCIVAGQLINAVSGGSVTIVLGIVILVVVSYLISFTGFRFIHRYEQVSWIVILLFICIEFGQSAKYFSPTPALSYSTGVTRIGARLNYFAMIFGQSAGWSTMVGDYYVHYPPKISKWFVFGMTWTGLMLPTCFILILGTLYGGMLLTNSTMNDIYNDGGIGAVILATMSPSGWSKFVCVVYALSFVGNVAPIYYSSSLCVQLWGKHFMAVPRFVWNTLLAAISLGLAVGGKNHLADIITDFLSLLGYWTLCFGTILAVEHFWFRPRIGGYDLEGWQDQDRMPLGIAGCISLALGIGVSFLGMNQTWYAGPAAKAIGDDGGDLGNYIAFVSVIICYPLTRHFEIKLMGR